jgi:hypothetical protein
MNLVAKQYSIVIEEREHLILTNDI